MPKRQRNYQSLDESGYSLTDAVRTWCAAKHPTIDIEGTFEVFCDKALANDWIYANWDAALRNYIRNGNLYGGIVYKAGMDNPAFAQLIAEARGIGFRDPLKGESPGAYRTALKAHDAAAVRGKAIPMPFKRVER